MSYSQPVSNPTLLSHYNSNSYVRSIGMGTLRGNVCTAVTAPLNPIAPSAMLSHSNGTLTGLRPTPPQFYPGQMPVSADMNTNARQGFKRTVSKEPLGYYYHPLGGPSFVSHHGVKPIHYTPPMSSSSRIALLKSRAIGKTVYKIGLSVEAPISTKCVDKSYTRSTLGRVRRAGCAAPAKKTSVFR